MAVTAYKSPGTCANVDRDGKVAWFDTDYAKVSDNAYAKNDPGKNLYGDWLRCTNFGFAVGDIPAGATINGIEVQIERSSVVANTTKDSALYLRKTAGQTGDNKASATSWPISDAYATYGAAADTWNAGLVDTDIKSTNFGVDLSIVSAPYQYAFGSVDHIQIRIYYIVVTARRSFGFIIS